MNKLEDNGEVAVKATEISATGGVRNGAAPGVTGSGGISTGTDHV